MAITPDEHPTVNDDNIAPLARHFLWVDTRRGVQKLIIGLMVLCAFLFAMDFIWHRHVKVPGEELYGFHAIAGFVSFTVIVLGAKMLRVFIRRDENFYAPHGVDAEEYPLQGTERLQHEDYRTDSLATLSAEILGREEGAGRQATGGKSGGNQLT